MPNYIENLGLEFLTETQEDTQNLLHAIVQEGKSIVGYYGLPYINQHFGNVQFIVSTEMDKKNKSLCITNLDTHCSGTCVWQVSIINGNLKTDSDDKLQRRCLVSRQSDGGGLTVINFVNADVLPSFLNGETVTAQMVAFPIEFDYFANEEEYENSVTEDDLGRKFMIGSGTFLPSGFLVNHNPNNEQCENQNSMDDYVLLRGTVKKLYYGKAKFGENEQSTFIKCIVNTDFGELEIEHTYEQVNEIERKNIAIGSVISGLFVLSGDVAIYEYEKGFIKDFDHNLKALQYIFSGGDEERLKFILSENAEYISDANKKAYTGRDEIIARLKNIREKMDSVCYPQLATITSIDDGEERLPYSIGTRCIALAYDDERNYEAIAFLDVENGIITKLYVCKNSRYHFKIDEKIQAKTAFENLEIPDNFIDPLIIRAHYHNFLDDTVDDDQIKSANDKDKMYKNNVSQMLDAWPKEIAKSDPEMLSNLFGYLFAKAIEEEYSDKNHTRYDGGLLIRYTPEDAWNGEITTLLDEARQKNLEIAMKYGKQFYKDFTNYFENTEDTTYSDNLLLALTIVQRIGQNSSKSYLK